MFRRDRRGGRGGLTLEEIHSSIRCVDCGLPCDDSGDSHHLEDSQHGSTPFHEALNEYLLIARPRSADDVRSLALLVARLVRLCGSEPRAWKVFVLAAFHRRYHGLAPAARESRLSKDPDGDGKAKAEKDAAATGDGERLVFYVTLLTLNRLAGSEGRAQSPSAQEEGKHAAAAAAAKAMVEACPAVGGTRDVNAIIEHLTFAELVDRGHASLEPVGRERGDALGKSFHGQLASALDELLCAVYEDSLDSLDPTLNAAIETVAALLDADLGLCSSAVKRGDGQGGVPAGEQQHQLMSTVHVTLPHRDRGQSNGSSLQRKLANSVAEVLIWRRTGACAGEERFSFALEGFREKRRRRAASVDDDNSEGREELMAMQTSVRKRRKVLNDAARSRGHMLCSAYLQDRATVKLLHIRKGKAGDLSELSRLAKKRGDTRVLKMIAARNADPTKANPMKSAGDLVAQWRDIRGEVAEEDSLEALELRLQAQTVRITVEKLQAAAMVATDANPRCPLVAVVGPGRENAVCAVLAAAALRPYSRLVLCDKDVEISTEDALMAALNEAIVGGGLERSFEARSAQSVLEGSFRNFEDAIVVSSSDVEVDEKFLERLRADGKTLRVHSAMKVEALGPVQVDLEERIGKKLKSQCPISVAVLLDCTGSMGCEIEGCKRGALAAIEAFAGLAPVHGASFLGYWDPPGSRGDPEPRSTGYKDPRAKKNLDDIQEFVDTQLPCTGGGDEPEDVPAALERLLEDMKDASLSPDDGVHFVFLIADAGYRHKEAERVTSLLEQLRELGAIVVMCPVRRGGTCQAMVAKVKEVFSPGRYIEVPGVSALSSIASTVTDSIRASLFRQSNVVSVTASVGETVDALCQLCAFQRDHDKMKLIGELVGLPEEEVVNGGDREGDSDGNVEEDDSEKMEEDDVHTEVMAAPGDATATGDEDNKLSARPTATFCPSNEFSVTNVDRIYMQISRLPPVCHRVVERAFGGRQLQEVVASEIAHRMKKDAVPITELQRAGYPRSIVEMVREMMGGHGLQRPQQ